MFFAKAESKNLLCRWRRSEGGDRIFFANLKLIIALKFSWQVLWRIRFIDTALSFSMVKGLFLHGGGRLEELAIILLPLISTFFRC